MSTIHEKHKQIAHARKRIDECQYWLTSHPYEHPEYNDMMSQLRLAELTLELVSRPEPLPSFKHSSQEYSLPKFK